MNKLARFHYDMESNKLDVKYYQFLEIKKEQQINQQKLELIKNRKKSTLFVRMQTSPNHHSTLQGGQYQQKRHYGQVNKENNALSQQQSNSQEDYELIPRQCPIYSNPLKDMPVESRSKPFVYKKMGNFHTTDHNSNNSLKDPIITILNDDKSIDSNPLLQKSLKQSQTSRKFIGSKTKFEQIGMKEVKSQNDISKNEVNKQQRDKEGDIQESGQKTISSRPIVSINSFSSEHQIEEVVAKYHFQTQKHFSQKVIKVNESSSPNLIKVSPDLSLQLHDDDNALFSLSQQKEDLTYTFSPKILQNTSRVNKKDQINENYGKDYVKLKNSMEKIDHLGKELLKNTENNINSLFSSKVSTDGFQVANMVDKINKKVGQVCEKVQYIEKRRIIEMEKQLQRRRNMEDKFQRQKEERRYYESRGDNVVLDLGRGSVNEGKIIAIYPSSKVADVKDLMFGKNEISTPSNASKQTDNTLKIMLQMQHTFISTLKTFQTSVDHSLNLKLSEIKKAYEKNYQSKKPSQETEQKLQQISQQTNDKQEQYDDSRGSINVLYLRRLRELEQEIKQKQWRIQRLEKENYYMERQLEKVQEVGFAKKKREGRSQLLSPLKNNEIIGESLSFSNKRKVYGSKNAQSTQFMEMKQKLSEFQVLIKEKDLRIRELEDTIMDHLESSRKWKRDIEQQSQSGKSQKVNEYSNFNDKQENVEILQMKISNLKTLLKQQKTESENYKRLYEIEKTTNQTSSNSNQHGILENTKITYDDRKSNTNTSRSLCISDKTNIRNDRNLTNVNAENSPFRQIGQAQTFGLKTKETSSCGKQTIFQSLINQNGTMSIIIDVLVNFIMMAWSLKEVITKLCGNEVNVEKINRNARQFISDLKEKDVNVWRKVWEKLDEGQFDSKIRQIWNE